MADEPKRHRIEVACPECGHVQLEPALVISTQCRSCRANFRVIDGKGEVRQQAVARFAKIRKDGEVDLPHAQPPPAAKPPLSRPVRTGPPPRSFIKRLLMPSKPPREVVCFGCEHHFMALGEAQSSQCPKCGSYVSLVDHEIDEAWNRRIETRGNVVIQKTGSVTGTSIRCHHLTVNGKLAGSVECSGDLVIRSHGRIIGAVRCKNLRIEKNAHVEFLNPVHAETASISGDVRGQLFCSGTVTLEKRARLHGLVRTASLIVKSGAAHDGTVEVIQPTTRPTGV